MITLPCSPICLARTNSGGGQSRSRAHGRSVSMPWSTGLALVPCPGRAQHLVNVSAVLSELRCCGSRARCGSSALWPGAAVHDGRGFGLAACLGVAESGLVPRLRLAVVFGPDHTPESQYWGSAPQVQCHWYHIVPPASVPVSAHSPPSLCLLGRAGGGRGPKTSGQTRRRLD